MLLNFFKSSILILLTLVLSIAAGLSSYNSANAQTTPAAPDEINLPPLDPDMTDEEKKAYDDYLVEMTTFQATIEPKVGTIPIPLAGATLTLPEGFYFLNPNDTRKVLEDIWGNPKGGKYIGMVFQNGTNAFVNDYAVVIQYDNSGYVSDEDAKDIDFDDLLKTMQKETKLGNKARVNEGYDAIDLIGWATPPKYDAENHRIIWSKKLKFASTEGNTLNYNMRFLGRRGVLEFNYVANEEALPLINEAMPVLSQTAEFNQGAKYTDFNPATDKVAAYGVAGLIAGGVVAKKLGFLGVLLLFLKKGWILIAAAVVFGKKFIGNIFNREKS